MTDWAAFAGFAAVVLLLLLALARLSQRALPSDGDDSTDIEDADLGGYVNYGPPAPEPSERAADDRFAAGLDADEEWDAETVETESTADTVDTEAGAPSATVPASEDLSAATLLANVLVTQGLFLGLTLAGVLLTSVPLVALGVAPTGATVPGLGRPSLGAGAAALGLGVALGGTLYVANRVGARVGERVGLGSSEALREALAPESAGGWAVLLGVVLPVIAVFEELLFRGILVGALTVGAVETGVVGGPAATGLPWVLVALSSVAFALGHGAQGRGGIVVTGLLGGVLGAAFALTWSLPLVVVAHYLVNALEFVVHEGLDPDWA